MFKQKKLNKIVIFLVGPTAVGKSEVAVCLAKNIGAEIISCDSMQVYRGMDVMTSKPSPCLLRKVKHHLVGVVPLSKEYSASLFRKDALKKIKDIHKRGKVPLVVGGTGLYSSVLINGIFECKAQDKSVRDKLYGIARNKGNQYLHRRLARVDPLAAVKIHFNDIRRIVRALEVFEITGSPITAWQNKRRGLKDEYDIRIFCLNMPRQELYNRINARVEKMFKGGLISEVKVILNKHLSKTASYSIGLKEVGDYLKGDCPKSRAIEMIKINTRHYAKRQLTWFRKDKSTTWINIHDKDKAREIADKIYRRI